MRSLLATFSWPKRVTRAAWIKGVGEGPPPLGGNCNFALCSRHTCPYCAHKADDPLLLLSSQTARQNRVGEMNPGRGRCEGG